MQIRDDYYPPSQDGHKIEIKSKRTPIGKGLNFFKPEARSPKIDPVSLKTYNHVNGGVYGSTLSHGPESAIIQNTDEGQKVEQKKVKLSAPKTNKQHVEASVFTMSSEECQWGIFDFSNTTIDPITGKINCVDDEDDEDHNRKNTLLYEECNFSVKGTNYITRQSKYIMGQSLPTEGNEGQRGMGALSVIQNRDNYQIYQNSNLRLDFTKQIKRSDDCIS